jgi:hypothetical protein
MEKDNVSEHDFNMIICTNLSGGRRMP